MDLASQEHPTTGTDLPGQHVSDEADDPEMMSPSVRLALRLSTLPSDFFDQVFASLATLPYDIWDDDAMANANPDVIMRDMNARRARMSPNDKVETSVLFVSEFEQTRDVSLLNQAAAMLRDAIDGFNGIGDNKGKYDALRRLTGCLMMRFECSGDSCDLNAAVEVVRETTQMNLDNADMAETFYTLGQLLSQRFSRLKDLDDLVEAVKNCMRGLSLLSEEDEHRPLFERTITEYVMTPLQSTQIMFSTRVRDALLDDSYLLSKRARAKVLNQVASALNERYERLGAIQDLEEKLILFRSSVELDPTDAMTMTAYGVSLLMRFE
ncbi:hypothetical protein K435DRAFT_881095, partial [Dendrothele bispora CBS 962.96]